MTGRLKSSKLRPAVDKRVLVFLAGLMWCSVGIMLVRFATLWLIPFRFPQKLLFYSAGFLAALPIHFFGFSRIAGKNLNRLLPFTEKKCIFSFMTWKSYIIVLIMISMGIGLRHSSIPRNYLSVLYNAIGLALFLSGLIYIRFFVRLLPGRNI